VIANVDGGDPVHSGFDLLAVPIIDDRDEAIPPQGRFAVGVVVEGVVVELRPFEDVARGHIAVCTQVIYQDGIIC